MKKIISILSAMSFSFATFSLASCAPKPMSENQNDLKINYLDEKWLENEISKTDEFVINDSTSVNLIVSYMQNTIEELSNDFRKFAETKYSELEVDSKMNDLSKFGLRVAYFNKDFDTWIADDEPGKPTIVGLNTISYTQTEIVNDNRSISEKMLSTVTNNERWSEYLPNFNFFEFKDWMFFGVGGFTLDQERNVWEGIKFNITFE